MANERKKPTIEELEAILNGPPQRIQLLPDGSICAVPDDTAEHDKRIRAEVLAAAITLFAQREPHYRAWAEPVRLLRNLQPAASALEALLRPGKELAELVLSVKPYEPHEPRDGRWEPVLEKARIISGGK